MAESEGWGSMPLEELAVELEHTTLKLTLQLETVATDVIAYWRRYWQIYTEIPPNTSAAACDRECQFHARAEAEAQFISESIRDSLVAKRDALAAILAARSI